MKNYLEMCYPDFKGWHKLLLVMKLSTIILFLCVIQVSASVYSQSTKFTCDFREIPLINVLKNIENQSDFKFFYQLEQIDVERQVNLAVSNKTAEEILEILFNDKSINYKILDNNIILLTPADSKKDSSGVTMITMQKSISGKVIDASGYAIPGVSVVISGTTRGALTDAEGFYSLPDVPENSVIIFSFVGMKTQKITFSGQTSINVTMEEDINSIDEVLVVAYGTAKKSSFTGSSTVLKSDKLEKISGSGFAESLQGMSAGVNVVNNEGNPGGNTRIQIRGAASINLDSNPLYVVDGMPYDGKLNSIASDDIESMTVLKDAAASSLYGSRAANGVVIITTKKGKTNKPQINYKSSWGTSDLAVKNPTKANPYQQLTNTWEGIYNDQYYKYGQTDAVARSNASSLLLGKVLVGFLNSEGKNTYVSPFKHIDENYVLEDGTVNPNLKMVWDESDYDWYGAVYSRKLRQDYSLDISGIANDGKTNYYFSVSYLDDNGYGLSQYFKRYSFRSNITTQITNWLQMGGSLAYSNSRQNNSGFIRALVFSNTLASPYLRNEDNTDWIYSQKTGNRMLSYGTYDNNFFGIHPLEQRGDYWNNPDDASFSNVMANMMSAKYFAEAKLSVNTKFRTNISVDDNGTRNFDYASAVHGSEQLAPYGVTVKTSGGSASRSSNQTTSITWNNLLTYDKKIGSHSFNILAGQELYSFRNYYDYCYGEGIMQLDQYEVSSTTSKKEVGSSIDNYALLSFFGKADYSYNDKYYLSASYRLDGSSRFSKENRWGSFASAGASWRLSQEDFMKDISWLDNLRLRASYGITGNDNVNTYYAYQALYESDDMFGNAGLKPKQLATPDLIWEKNIQFNVAADFTIFKNISGTIEYFKRKAKDLLYYKELPLSSQAGSATGYFTNLGDIENSGFEVSVNAGVINTRDFKWNIDANWSSLRNRITYLPGGEYTFSERTATYKMAKGHSRYEFFMPSSAGVDPETGNALYWIKNSGGAWETTSAWSDVTADDYQWQGSALPKGYGAITNNFQYKGFDLSAMLYYSYGGMMLDYIYMERVTLRDGVSVIQDLVGDRWRKPGDNASLPRWSQDDFSSTRKATNFWIFKNNYMRLRNLNIGYSLPKKVIEKVGITKARVYLSGDNLMTFGSAKKRHTDPETGASGNNYNGNSATDNGYPGSRRVYMGGIQVSF
jgi:TonB-linked SusC/RagA family outer membrane protein